MQLALAIAHTQQAEIECLQVISVPRHRSPAETTVDITPSQRLLRQVARQAQRSGIPLHTQIRVAHTIEQGILDTVKERHVDLLLMGWKGNTSNPDRIFGNVVDAVIRQAPSDVVLVKFGQSFIPPILDLIDSNSSLPASRFSRLNRWLVPIAGGPNSRHALDLLPALISLSQEPQISLCQVFSSQTSTQDLSLLNEDSILLRERLNAPVAMLPVCAPSVSSAIIDLSRNNQCDVVVVGASREGFLQQAIQGNIPEAIARGCNCTVILVRKAPA
jgi:CIC family chloride channel protein